MGLILLIYGCRKQDEAFPLDAQVPVSTINDLPATYQPFREGSTMAGRVKSETQNGNLTGEWRYNERGQLTEWRMIRFDEVQSAVQYRYDRAGQLRFVQHFDNSCRFSSSSTCTGPVKWTSYEELTTNAAGRVAESRAYLKVNGAWDSRSARKHEYDAQGRMAT